MTSDLGGEAPEILFFAVLMSAVALLSAFLAAPLLSEFVTPGLLISVSLLLLLMLIILAFYPDHNLRLVTAGIGAVLFAVWTVYDVMLTDCEHPAQKSIQVFLDLLNLYQNVLMFFDK